MQIIPAIDLIDGKCVRLSQGDYATAKTYFDDPLEVAKRFEDAGITRLHLVDLDGAKAGRVVNHGVLDRISKYTDLVIDFGGGLKRREDLDIVFASGAHMATVGSVAARQPELFLEWLQLFGAERMILGADARGGKVAVSGWLDDTELDVVDFARQMASRGVRQVISTDIAKDGMLTGPSFELYEALAHAAPGLRLVASGGIGSLDDLRRLKAQGLHGAIVGKAFYEGHISLRELADF